MAVPSVYPVTVPEGSSVLLDLEVLDIPDRHPLHPQLYKYTKAHPHHRLRPKNRSTYVYLIDPSPEGKAVAVAIEKEMKVPPGPISGTCHVVSTRRYLTVTFSGERSIANQTRGCSDG